MSGLLQTFQQTLQQQGWQEKKILAAVSGGVDSMCLAALLNDAGVKFQMAHCNFGLRGAESDGDEQMVRQWAEGENIPLHVRRFNTPGILKEEGGNLQDTARRLRYQWFEELRKQLEYDFVAVAHHRQDSIETLLINFFKGCGISGMHGILPRQGQIIRPLLALSKEDLTEYARSQQIPWREDSSNAKDSYLRNKIRHQLLPQIEEVFPQAISALEGNMKRMQEAEVLYDTAISHYRKKLLEKRGKDWYLPVLKLLKCQPLGTVLFEILRPFGFHPGQLPDILHLLKARSGKWVAAKNYRVLRDRDFLVITTNVARESTFIRIAAPEADRDLVITLPDLELNIQRCDAKLLRENKEKVKEGSGEFIALKETDFPLQLRLFRQGDYFYPLGMGRKKKKVGKFLRDLKIPLHEKERVWVLESKRRIVWVLGYRLDERFKISQGATSVWQFSLEKKDNNQTKN